MSILHYCQTGPSSPGPSKPVLTFGKLDEKFKPMIFHGENEAEILNSKVTVDWNITPESIDEPETLSESYHAILSFQDFTDFFGDLVEKQQKVMTRKKFTADSLKYLGEFIKSGF